MKAPLYINNEDWMKMLKSISFEIVNTMIKTKNSTECSNEIFQNVILMEI